MKDGYDGRLRQLTLAGLLGAIIFLLTVLAQFPIPNTQGAYVNLGDAGVYLAAYLLPFPWCALAAGVGSALADLMLGAALYAGPTFLIKGGMALLAWYLLPRWPKHILALLCAGLLMPAGYFFYESLLYGLPAAAVSIPLNLAQYAVGIALGLTAIRLTKSIKKS